jgi:16S rRNA (guanine966-N2)-methyltransferase
VRIVAGSHRGRALVAPEGREVRPTSDRAREALFNILVHGGFGEGGGSILQGARVVDGFAGTGALGLEALSRGAAHATFIERDRAALAALRRNIAALKEEGRTRIVQADATAPPPAAQPAILALLDPPYRSGLGAPALLALARGRWLASGALASLEIAARGEEFAPPEGFTVEDERRYGAAKILLLRHAGG